MIVRAIAAGLLLALAAVAAPAGAQPAEVPPARYDATVAIDLELGSLEVDWAIEFAAPEADTVAFLLNAGLTISDWEGAGVRDLRIAPWDRSPDWNRVALALDPAVDGGDPLTLRLAYSGVPAWPENGMNRISVVWVELNVDSAWHPVLETFGQYLVGDLEVELPADWTVASSGTVERVGDRWRIEDETPQIDAAFAASPRWETVESGRFRIGHTGDQEPVSIARLLDTAEDCARWLDARYGQRDSIGHGWFVVAPREESGYARGNYVVLTDLDESTDENVSTFVCHELAHTWATGADPMSPENWLNEGLAQYVAARFVRERHGVEAFRTMLSEWEAGSKDQPPVWTPNLEGRPPFAVAYRKAPVLLHRLEERIGESDFDRLLVAFLGDPARDTTPELLELVEGIGGAATRAWFEAELAR